MRFIKHFINLALIFCMFSVAQAASTLPTDEQNTIDLFKKIAPTW